VERDQLEHVLRAAAAITREDEFIVVGSQAILGAVPDAPADLKISREVDLYPRFRPELADLIDGALGEASHFDDTFGYYAQGVGEETAVVPKGWQDRLVRVQTPATRGAIGGASTYTRSRAVWLTESNCIRVASETPPRERRPGPRGATGWSSLHCPSRRRRTGSTTSPLSASESRIVSRKRG
jgi:hypothetical protein